MKYVEVLEQKQVQVLQLVLHVAELVRSEELQEHLLVILLKLQNVQLVMVLDKQLLIHVQVVAEMVLNKLEKNYVLIYLLELIREPN